MEQTELLTCRQLARRFGKHVKTIRKWARNGDLPKRVRLPDGTYGWRPEAIDRWLDGREVEETA